MAECLTIRVMFHILFLLATSALQDALSPQLTNAKKLLDSFASGWEQ
jgi:hypothetical protein